MRNSWMLLSFNRVGGMSSANITNSIVKERKFSYKHTLLYSWGIECVIYDNTSLYGVL